MIANEELVAELRSRTGNVYRSRSRTNRAVDKRAANAIAALTKQVEELTAERDDAMGELGRVVMACPMRPDMRTSPVSAGVRSLRTAFETAERQRDEATAEAAGLREAVLRSSVALEPFAEVGHMITMVGAEGSDEIELSGEQLRLALIASDKVKRELEKLISTPSSTALTVLTARIEREALKRAADVAREYGARNGADYHVGFIATAIEALMEGK